MEVQDHFFFVASSLISASPLLKLLPFELCFGTIRVRREQTTSARGEHSSSRVESRAAERGRWWEQESVAAGLGSIRFASLAGL